MTWPLVTLEKCSRIVSGATPKTGVSAFWDGDIWWVTPKDLSDIDGVYIDTTARRISASGLASCAAEVLPPNSVLFSSRAPIGHVAINRVPMATNQGFKSFLPDRARLEPGYLYWWLKGHRSYLESLGNGATFKELSKAAISRVEIPLPPVTEQRRIAAILDQADELRRKRAQTLERLDALIQAIFVEMFIESENSSWSIGRLADIATDVRTGPFGSQLLHAEFVDEGIAVLGIDNAVTNEFQWDERRYITPEKYRSLHRYTVKPGDVLITIMGTCGRCAVVPNDIPTAINTKHLCCITLDATKVLPTFLHAAFLQHPSILKQLGVQAKGAVMPGLNMGIIKSLELRIPPLDLQRTFASRIAVQDEVRARCREHKEKLDALFASLQHRAFNGGLTSKQMASEMKKVG